MENNFTFLLLNSDDGVFDMIFKGFSIVGVLVSIIGVIFLIRYTIETIKLRRNSDKEAKSKIRPIVNLKNHIDFIAMGNSSLSWKKYSIYCHKNLAFNIKIFRKSEELWEVKKQFKMMEIDEKKTLSKDNFQIIEKLPLQSNKKKYINNYKWDTLIIYEDINQNKLFTLIYLDDKNKNVMETKYLDEI